MLGIAAGDLRQVKCENRVYSGIQDCIGISQIHNLCEFWFIAVMQLKNKTFGNVTKTSID
jgi:hypothetical protein